MARSTATLQNSLLALNNGGNCSASVLDGGHNLSFGDTTCPATFANGDPNLGPLQNNGGQAPTISLQPGSAAINQIPATGANCTPSDERGVPRPSGAACDIGAYEVAPPIAVTTGTTKVTTTSATISGTITANAGTSTIVFQYGTSKSYGTTTPVQKFGGTAKVSLNASLVKLKPKTTYHYRIVIVAMDGTGIGGDRTFTTASPIPSIRGLSIKPKAFRPSKGTTIKYTDSLAARTTLTAFLCTRTHRGKCTRYVKQGSSTRSDRAGRNTVKIKRRIGNKALVKGSYKLEVRPRAGGKIGKTVSAKFQVN